MNRFIIMVLLATIVVINTHAQNRSINFEQTKVWKEIAEKAKTEKKLIFMDCYTPWCGACMIMAKQIFTQDSVADFFNEHFVNAKYDMIKDSDGVILKEKFGITRFPTLLYIDPESQELVHYVIGARKAATLIADGKQALDPKNNLASLKNRYASGEREPEFMVTYLSALSFTYQANEIDRLVSEYMKTLTPAQFATKAGWEFIREYINDPLSAPLKQVMNERKKFYAIAGQEAVDTKLKQSISTAAKQLVEWTPETNAAFNEKRNRELTEYLLKIDFEAAPENLAKLYLAAYVRKGDFRGLLDKMEDVANYNLLRGRLGRYYFLLNMGTLTQCKDKPLVEEGIKRIDAACAATQDYFYKAELMNCKANLQNGIGDTVGAEKSKAEEVKYATEGKKRRGKLNIRIAPKN